MIFWHVGATTAFIRYAFRDPAMDLRYLALGALLPDIVDLPLGIVMWSEWQAARLIAHSIVFGSLVMLLVLVFTRRGPVRKQWMLLAVGVLLHLLLSHEIVGCTSPQCGHQGSLQMSPTMQEHPIHT